MKKITINSTEFILKYTIRALFVFENMTGKIFSFGKLVDEYILFYSTLLANNESFSMPFDEFISACDSDPSLFDAFKEFLLNEIELRSQSATKDVKKKTTRKKR